MGNKRSKRYSQSQVTIDRDVLYSPSDAVTLVKNSSTASFDETIELHARLNVDSRQADQQVRGVVVLPHGVGKTLNVLVFASGEAQTIAEDAGADFVGAEELIERVEKGWTDFDVNLDMNNSYIVAMEFTNVDATPGGVYAPLDDSAAPSSNSMVLFTGGSWDLWSVSGASVGDGEWGVKANISYSGAGVAYEVYRDGVPVAPATDNSYTDTGLDNNVTYVYTVSICI